MYLVFQRPHDSVASLQSVGLSIRLKVGDRSAITSLRDDQKHSPSADRFPALVTRHIHT